MSVNQHLAVDFIEICLILKLKDVQMIFIEKSPQACALQMQQK